MNDKGTQSGTPVLAGGGEMGERIRTFDWSRHPLGVVEQWPESLKTIIRVMLDSRYAMWLGWGSDLTFFYNDAYAAMTLGPKHPWALGRSAREVWSEIWTDIGPRAESVLQTGRATWDERLLLFLERRGFPEETYHTFSYSPVPGDQGRVGGMLCVVTEDTERTIGERRLRILRELSAKSSDETRSAESACAAAATILAASPRDVPFSLFYLVDKDGRRASLVGSSGIASGTASSPVTIDLDSDDAPWPFPRVNRTGQAVVLENAVTANGTWPGGEWPEPAHQAVVLPISKPGASQMAGFIVAGISPRRPLDDAYRGFLDLLAGQVSTAVADARAYEEERSRAEALAQLDLAKTTFFSNVSHEFRTPLTLMLGPIEDLLARPDDAFLPGEHETLSLIHRNSLRLLKLVNTLLDFARIEAGRTRAQYEPTDIAGLTRELSGIFRSAIEKAGLRLNVDCPDLDHVVYVDRDMWEKIILNLLSNAMKFTFEGEIEVKLRQSDGRVEVVVRDTGVGIPAKDLPHVFDRFHRVEGTKCRTYEGTGIGLALVCELTKLHGGTVHVDSVEGRGTTFTVSLPTGSDHLPADRIIDGSSSGTASLAPRLYVEEALRWLPRAESLDADVLPITEPPDPLSVASSSAGTCEQQRVLLADDNADMRQYVTRLLAGRFETQAVADGLTALEAARANPPDLILSDVMMPRLDGFGLLRELRNDPALRHIPVILLSARAGEESRVDGMRSGADDYLTKPFSGRELLARVSAHLQLARLRREAEVRERGLRREAEILNEVAQTLAAELDHDALLQKVTDAGTSITNAAFGAFFYNQVNEQGESYQLYTLSGAPRAAFEKLGMPRNTALFGPTFRGEGPIRIDDVLADPRYGRNSPHHGMPKGHLPVRSYLAVPVASREGGVLGGLFFGHPDPGVFTERSERLALGIAGQAAIAIDNARLYGQAQAELQERERAQHALRQRTAQYETLLNQAPLGVYLVDADLRIREVNPAARLAFGSVPDLIGRDLEEVLRQLWNEEYVDEVIQIVRHTLRTGEPKYVPERAEYRLDRGLTEYYEWRVDRIPTPDGRFGVVCYFRDISVQVLARSAIAQSERRFREMVDALPAAVYTTDAQGRLTHFNRVCTELAGHVPSIGTDRWCVTSKLFRPDGTPLPPDECPMAIALREARPIRDQEIVAERPDGTRVWIMPYPTPLFDEAGRVAGGINMLVDITSRKQAEEQLRRNRDTFFNLVQNAPFGVYVVDSDFRLAQLSVGSQKVFQNAGPLLGRDFAEILRSIWPEPFASEAIARFRHTLATGETYHAPNTTERRCDTADLESYDWKLERVSLPDGQYGVVCYFYDLTALRVAQQAVRESEARYRAIVESQSEMVCRFEPEGKILFVNNAYAAARATSPEEIIGRNFWDFIVEKDRPAVRALLDRIRLDTPEVRIENRFETHRGPRWSLWTNRGLAFNADGVATELQSVGIDITDRKIAEQALREREQSEREARAEVEQASRLKDEFLATLSHELRTPLSAILGWSRLIDKNPGDVATVKQGIEVISRNAKVQTDLIADLLDMSRIISGKIRLEVDSVDLSDVVMSAIDAVRHAAEAKEVRIQTIVSPFSDPVRGDASRLQQVVWNLLSNAVKFTPKGGRIQILLSKKNSHAEIVVSDTGVGVRAEFLPHIFERFRQADASTARFFGGLGLGLSIVKHLVELHGGTVRAASPGENQGATFTVELPLALMHSPDRVDAADPDRANANDFALRGVRVLAVDDQADARDLLRRVLEERAAEVVTAASADEGLRALEQYRPHVVLCDIGMPGKDGFEFIRSARDRGDETPAVAVTAFARSEDRLRALRAGFQGHVSKPVEPAELVATVAVFAKSAFRAIDRERPR